MSVHATTRPLPRGLEVERRDSRESVEVTLPFKVLHGTHRYEGLRLSRTHLVVARTSEAPDFEELRPIDVALHLSLSGTETVLPLSIVVNASDFSANGEWTLLASAMRPPPH
ncbi:MAG: hypothetical protein QM744_04920 [Mesorhizobium sp.]